jgi:hypothetical protein
MRRRGMRILVDVTKTYYSTLGTCATNGDYAIGLFCTRNINLLQYASTNTLQGSQVGQVWQKTFKKTYF